MADLLNPELQRVVETAARKGIALDIRPAPGSLQTAEEIAAAVDAGLDQIVKPLVFVAGRPETRPTPIVCLVAGSHEVDLAMLAAVTGEVGIQAATPREVNELTGYSVGALPPFGYGRGVRVVMDQDLCQHQWIWASAAGAAVIKVEPRTLRILSNAEVAPVVVATWMRDPAGAAVEPSLRFEASPSA